MSALEHVRFRQVYCITNNDEISWNYLFFREQCKEFRKKYCFRTKNTCKILNKQRIKFKKQLEGILTSKNSDTFYCREGGECNCPAGEDCVRICKVGETPSPNYCQGITIMKDKVLWVDSISSIFYCHFTAVVWKTKKVDLLCFVLSAHQKIKSASPILSTNYHMILMYKIHSYFSDPLVPKFQGFVCFRLTLNGIISELCFCAYFVLSDHL